MKKIYESKVLKIITKTIIILSFPFLTILLSTRYDPKHIFIGAILSFLTASYIIIKKVSLRNINVKKFLISTALSLYGIKLFLHFSQNNIILLDKIIQKIMLVKINYEIIQKFLGLLSVPSLILIIYIFIDKGLYYCKNFSKELTKTDRRYLTIITIFSVIITFGIINTTTAFSKPYYEDNLKLYDVIYTSDSGIITYENAYLNVSNEENDIRQPLFGVFSLPFSITASLLSEICFFLPKGYEFEFIMTIIQFLLTTITTIMIGKIMKIEEKDKKFLYLLFSFSFPYIIFNMLLEQYVIALFYLVFAMYYYETYKEKINYLYIGAVGTLLTSGIIFPAISKFKNIKDWTIKAFKCFLSFVSVLIISGQFPQILTAKEVYQRIMVFTNNTNLTNKIYQFTNFVSGIFISEKGAFKILNETPSYQLIGLKFISIIGILILILLTVSFIINRKEKIAQLSYAWVIFSFILLFIIGWGTAENGLILYSLYFAWAYLVLYFLFIKKVFKKRKAFVAIITFSIIIMATFNISEFLNILKFAIKYY